MRCGAQLPAELAHVCLDGVRGVVFDAATARSPSIGEPIAVVLLLTDAGADEGLVRAFHSAASDEREQRAAAD